MNIPLVCLLYQLNHIKFLNNFLEILKHKFQNYSYEMLCWKHMIQTFMKIGKKCSMEKKDNFVSVDFTYQLHNLMMYGERDALNNSWIYIYNIRKKIILWLSEHGIEPTPLWYTGMYASNTACAMNSELFQWQ